MNNNVNPNETLNKQPTVVPTATNGSPTVGVVPAVPQVPTSVESTVAKTPVVSQTPTAVTTPIEQPVSTIPEEKKVPVETKTTEISEKKLPEQRVILVNDKPGIKGIMPTEVPHINSELKKEASKVSEETEILDVVEESTEEIIEEEIQNNKGPNFFQKLFMFIVFGGLFAMVIYLPDISSYIQTQKYLKEQVDEKITTGTLKCSLEKNSENLDYSYELDFGFASNKLTRLTYVHEVRGDVNLDDAELSELYANCEKMSTEAEKLTGVTASCKFENGIVTQRQVFNYASVNRDEAMAIYTEAGGIYPNYKNGEDMDKLEKNMNADGYSCERIK